MSGPQDPRARWYREAPGWWRDFRRDRFDEGRRGVCIWPLDSGRSGFPDGCRRRIDRRRHVDRRRENELVERCTSISIEHDCRAEQQENRAEQRNNPSIDAKTAAVLGRCAVLHLDGARGRKQLDDRGCCVRVLYPERNHFAWLVIGGEFDAQRFPLAIHLPEARSRNTLGVTPREQRKDASPGTDAHPLRINAQQPGGPSSESCSPAPRRNPRGRRNAQTGCRTCAPWVRC